MTSQRGAQHAAETEKWLAYQRDSRKSTLSEAALSRWGWLNKDQAANFAQFYERLPNLQRLAA